MQNKPVDNNVESEPELEKVMFAYIGTATRLGVGGTKTTEEDFYKVKSDGSYNTYRSKWKYYDAYELQPLTRTKKFLNKYVLYFLLLISILSILFHNVVFNEIPEFFSKGYEIGSVISKIGLAYVASFIFYLIVVVKKSKQNRKNIFSIVYGLTNTLVYYGNSVFKLILECAGKDEMEFSSQAISRVEFNKICEVCNVSIINDQGRSYGIEIEQNGVNLVDTYVERIFNYMPFLDGEYVVLISKIENTRFFKHAGLLIFGLNPNIKNLSNIIYDYLVLIEQVNNYNTKQILKELK
ncbi:hypothetical protein [Rasiella sp. SM2506]|uniref:hypothetical protein n=1 Tax=Rasiella sp. SM2506 TaxID=3423914 RepID=UPI003D78FEC4